MLRTVEGELDAALGELERLRAADSLGVNTLGRLAAEGRADGSGSPRSPSMGSVRARHPPRPEGDIHSVDPDFV